MKFKKTMEIEYRTYNTIQNGIPSIWYYGIEKKEVDLSKNSYIAVVDLKGLSDIKKEFGENVISFYISVDEESRRLRAISRDLKY